MEALKTRPLSIQEIARLNRLAPVDEMVIEDIQNNEAEMPWMEDDFDEIFVSVSPEYFHKAVIAGILFDEINRFKKEGFFLSQRAARYLQEELNIPLKRAPEVTVEKADISLNGNETYGEEENIEDAMDTRVPRRLPKTQVIYSERRHKRVRNSRDLL